MMNNWLGDFFEWWIEHVLFPLVVIIFVAVPIIGIGALVYSIFGAEDPNKNCIEMKKVWERQMVFNAATKTSMPEWEQTWKCTQRTDGK